MRFVVLHPYTKFEVRRPCRSEDMAHDVSALMDLVTLNFDLLTLKLVCESRERWGTFIPNLGTLGLRVLKLFVMYAYGPDGKDGQNQQPTGGGITSVSQSIR